MTRPVVLPSPRSNLAALERRIFDLERALARTKTKKQDEPDEIVEFSVVGDMEVSTSGIYRVVRGGLIAVNFDATAAGTGTTTFDVLINGASPGSAVSVASGTTASTDDIGSQYARPGDELQIDITAAGMHVKAVIQVVMSA